MPATVTLGWNPRIFHALSKLVGCRDPNTSGCQSIQIITNEGTDTPNMLGSGGI